jgi:eukaryotic-like serine/threonine-protein kinase
MIQGTTKICKKCKSLNRPSAVFCISCGLMLTKKDHDIENNELNNDFKNQPFKTGLENKYFAQDMGDRFQVNSVIFNDSDGSVFEAWDSLNKNDVIFKGDLESDLDQNVLSVFRSNFRISGRRFQSVSLPQIPGIRDFFYTHSQYCVVMDYVKGKSLDHIINKSKERSIKTTFAVKCILAICEILESLHSLKPPIYHLNIKPTKVIVNDEGKVNLVPWLIRPGIYGELIGTRGYASPEQYYGECDCRSDVYGVGALLHTILTCKDPQKEVPFHFLPLSILRPDLSGEIEMVISKALNLKREDRYQSIREFSVALFSAAGKYFK